MEAERGWKHLRLYSDLNDAYSRDYHAIGDDGGDVPSLNVFTRRDGTIRHFWGGEFTGDSADPGQDPRGAPEMALLPEHSGLRRRRAGRRSGIRKLELLSTLCAEAIRN